MRALVTGSEGRLGRELVARLGAADHHVVGLDLPDHDVTDRDVVVGAITSWRPDVVLHTAALTDVDRCESEVELAYRCNALATRFVADGARRVGAHVVHLSTDYVFDGTKSTPYVEWDDPSPLSVYGRSKLGGEREIDPGWTVARTSWLFGGTGRDMVSVVLDLAARGGELRFVRDQVGHPTFVGDLADRVLLLAARRLPGVFHVTNSGAVSWHGFAREVLAAAGDDPDRVRPITTAELDPPRPARRPANSVLDNLAWRGHGLAPPRDFRDALVGVVRDRLSA